MGKLLKNFFTLVIILLVIVGAFVAGDYFDLNLSSLLGLTPKSHTAETLPDSEPHTAEEVIEVETVVPIDASGAGSVEIVQQKVPYVIDVDFAPVLLKEAQLEKKLIVMTQKATASEIAKKDGLFGLSVFKQTKAIIFHGEGTYFVDLSSLSSADFVIDKENKTITIYIPKPQLTVKLLSNETEFFDASNGSLRFGEMEITPEAMTTLQTQGIARITEVLEADETAWDTAIKFAKLSVKEIYEPLVAAQIEAALQNAADEYAIPAYYTIIVEIKNS